MSDVRDSIGLLPRCYATHEGVSFSHAVAQPKLPALDRTQACESNRGHRALGFWDCTGRMAAKDCAATRFGYAAGYSFGAAISLAVLLCGIGLLLLLYWRTRGVGIGLVAAGFLTCLTFYGGIAILLKLDRVAWKHEPPLVAFGPDQKATIVIYFKRGITDEQIEEFRSSMLTGIEERTEYLRLLPDQAHGHEGVALTLSRDASPEQVTRYVKKIEGDSRVEKVYRDIAPTDVPPQPNPMPTVKNSG
jgi:hypothetical protein